MKINNGYNDSQTSAASNAQRTQETGGAPGRGGPAGAGGRADEVNLSPLAPALRLAMSDSPEREAMLERLAAEIESGAYQPDAMATARGLINETLAAQADGDVES